MPRYYSIILILIQYILLSSLFEDFFGYSLKTSSKDNTRLISSPTSNEAPIIFDSRVLETVKTLFTRSLILNAALTKQQNGRKKSIIETAITSLHVKIDPRQFGQTLLNTAEQNAARKSDIYMNKAIDATALGVAVLKLIFGKDAKMIMKDSTDKDVQASLRAKAYRPITSWSIPTHETITTGERKSLLQEQTTNPRKSDKIEQLNLNILKLVKSLQPVSHLGDKSGEVGKMPLKGQSIKHTSTGASNSKSFGDSESNLARLLSLMEQTKKSAKVFKQKNGEKKSWVLLKVPTKQPEDELGMLSDPNKQEETTKDDSSHNEQTGHNQQQQHKQLQHKEQSNEGKSLTNNIALPSKTLKSEPVQEVNPVKTDTTPQVNYEDSVKNLLRALETSERTTSTLQQKAELVPEKKIEENAASKDDLSGGANTGGAVVSLDALRQLGKILGLSNPQAESKISPYTGTQDTLTLATPMPPQSLQDLLTTTPAPTPPPTPTVPPTTAQQNQAAQEASLNRISEQLKMFAERGLRIHNEYRRLHHAEPLMWSEDLASAAEKLAYQAAKRGVTTRSELVEKKGYGENVAMITNVALENAGEEAVRHWYNERENFTFSDPGITETTKAFTQMIWKDTKILGMGAAKDDDTGELYVVALYSPKGNDEGSLRENVQADGKQQTDVYASIFKKSLASFHETNE